MRRKKILNILEQLQEQLLEARERDIKMLKMMEDLQKNIPMTPYFPPPDQSGEYEIQGIRGLEYSLYDPVLSVGIREADWNEFINKRIVFP